MLGTTRRLEALPWHREWDADHEWRVGLLGRECEEHLLVERRLEREEATRVVGPVPEEEDGRRKKAVEGERRREKTYAVERPLAKRSNAPGVCLGSTSAGKRSV